MLMLGVDCSAQNSRWPKAPTEETEKRVDKRKFKNSQKCSAQCPSLCRVRVDRRDCKNNLSNLWVKPELEARLGSTVGRTRVG